MADAVAMRPLHEFPVLAGEVGSQFPFQSWAVANQFKYPEAALPMLRKCGSAAEAFFLRAFLERDGVQLGAEDASCNGIFISPQERVRGYFVDVVVRDATSKLAIEVDGLGFHHRKAEQVQADYLRERRIVLAGFTIVRFLAAECFSNPTECWRQITAILEARRA